MSKPKSMICIIAISIISLVLCLFLIDKSLGWYYGKEEKIPANVQIDITQYLGGVLKTIDLCEKNGIHIDDDFKNELKKYSKGVLENYSEEGMQITTLTHLIFIDDFFQFGYGPKLSQLLDEYYIPDKKLFSQLKYSEYIEDIIESQLNIFVALTVSQTSYLNDSSEHVRDYSINEGLANWFNNNIHTNIELEPEDEALYIDNLVSVFWYFYSINKLDLIKYEDVLTYIEEDIVIGEDEILLNEYEYDIRSAILADELSSIYEVFYNDHSLEHLSVEIFNQISSEQDFYYDKEYNVYFNLLADYLANIGVISGNEFFSSQINSWLRENYENSMQSLFEQTF